MFARCIFKMSNRFDYFKKITKSFFVTGNLLGNFFQILWCMPLRDDAAKLKCDKENIPKVINAEFTAFDKVEGKIYEDFSNEKEWDIHYEHLRSSSH